MCSNSQKVKIIYKFFEQILLSKWFLNVEYVILFLSTLFCKMVFKCAICFVNVCYFEHILLLTRFK